MAKLKNSLFPLEQENAFHVYRKQELYDATKYWQKTHSWAKSQNKHLAFSLTLTVEVNTSFI